MNFDFGNVLTRAWQIIWKHKVLWIFGILASCSRGNGGGNSGGSRSSNSAPDQFGYQFEQFSSWMQDNWWIIAILVLFVILLTLVFTAIGYIGRIALIKGTHKAEQGAESLPFGELFSESLPYFWRVFGLSFLVGLVFFVILMPLVLIGVFTAGVGFLCILPLICILIPVAIAVNLVLEQANAAIVLEDLGMFDGFKRGWEVVKNNAGATIIMALILGIGGGIVGLVIAIPIFIAIVPIVFGAAAETTAMLWVGIACVALYLPVIIFFNGVLTAYIQSAWTLTFMRLTAPAPKLDEPLVFEANA